jgi:hypothetical protein
MRKAGMVKEWQSGRRGSGRGVVRLAGIEPATKPL